MHCKKKIKDYENIVSVNPLYLMNHGIIGHTESNSIKCTSTECHSIEEKMIVNT